MCKNSNQLMTQSSDELISSIHSDKSNVYGEQKPANSSPQLHHPGSSHSVGWIEELSSSQQFVILSSLMFLSFGVHNLLQEAIIKVPGFEGVMLTYMEVLGVTICSFVERRYIAKESGRVAPLSSYPALTICLLGSSALSNMSLNYINFPTKVVFRSCKLIPTMIIATVINRRVFKSVEYASAFAISIGLIVFAAADWNLTPSFNPIGLALVITSVVADAILPNIQERNFSLGASRLEVTLYTNFMTLIVMTATTVWSGGFFKALKMALLDSHLAAFMVVYTAISYIAISLFMTIVKQYGGVTAVVLGTARKAMSLILSFLFFPKAFSWFYVLGAGLVLGGLTVTSLTKHFDKRSARYEVLEQQEDVEMNKSRQSS